LSLETRFLKKISTVTPRTIREDLTEEHIDINKLKVTLEDRTLENRNMEFNSDGEDISIEVGDNSSDISSITDFDEKYNAVVKPERDRGQTGESPLNFDEICVTSDLNISGLNNVSVRALEKPVLDEAASISSDKVKQVTYRAAQLPQAMPEEEGRHRGFSPKQNKASLVGVTGSESPSMPSVCDTSMSKVTDISNLSPQQTRSREFLPKKEFHEATERFQTVKARKRELLDEDETTQLERQSSQSTSLSAPSAVELALAEMQQKMNKLLKEQNDFKSQIQHLSSTLIEISEENEALRHKQQQIDGKIRMG